MNRVILDTNFIMTCLKEKIDFLDAEEFGKLIVPTQVLEELEKLSNDKKISFKDRERAFLAIQIIIKNREKIDFVDLEKKFVDRGIVMLVEEIGRGEAIVASLDKGLRRELKDKARFLTIQARGKLDII